uniref:Uncharacterized protein n=1 Tax=Platynereis dumerilii TaxID=6359 RepID=A4VAZ7_PLADU|nr:hypothetical protein [Platynereis dumerilii]
MLIYFANQHGLLLRCFVFLALSYYHVLYMLFLCLCNTLFTLIPILLFFFIYCKFYANASQKQLMHPQCKFYTEGVTFTFTPS